MNRIDLHTHSTVSDGTLTPSELVLNAYHCGLYAIALTDHDTADGLPEAMDTWHKLQKNHPFECIPGIELAVSYMERELHIVGLYLDITSKDFGEALIRLQKNRNARNEKMIVRMKNAGIDITMEKLYADQGPGIKTRANFARYLLDHGYIKTMKEGFDKYLDAGKPFYVPREYMHPKDAIDLIHSLSGIAILAHPLLYHFDRQSLERAVHALKDMGLDGLEAYYSMNSTHDTAAMKALAKKNGLILSGGSDFHGSNKPHIQLGKGRGNLYIPEDVLKQQKLYLEKKLLMAANNTTQ